MKVNQSVLLFFILLLLFSFLSAQFESKLDPLCGPKSLLVVCQKLGIKTNLDELKQLSDYEEGKGTTMAGLYKAAEAKGLYAVGMKISLDELAKLKVPIIAYLQNKHCVVIDKFERNIFRIVDFPEESYLISKEQFAKDYSGFSLLVSKAVVSFPKMEIKGPDIRFDEYTYDFGETEYERKVEHIFKFRNVGKEELTISKVEPAYPFTFALLSANNIPPESKEEIKVTFDPRYMMGFRSASVYVHSNDPVTPLVKLRIQGKIKTEPVVSSRYIHFEDVKRGTLATKKIYYVVRPEDEKLRILKAESSSKYLSTTVSKSTHEHYGGFEIEVTLTPDIPIGKLDEKIIIYTTSEKHPTIEIPVTGNIKGDIEFDPPTFFFGIVKQGEIRKSKITVFTTGKEPLKIEKIENPMEFISVAATPKVEGKEYELIASLKSNAPTDSIKGNITIYTNNLDQPKIEILVYALVQE